MSNRTHGNLAIGLLALGALALPVAAAADVAAIYAKQCASCHGAGGKGDGPASKMIKPPAGDFTAPAWQAAAKDADLAKAIKEGGPAVGKAKSMPAYPKLTDEEVDGLVKLIRSFK